MIWTNTLLTTLGLAYVLAAPSHGDEPSFRIAGYLPDYRMAEFQPEAARGYTDLIVFSASVKPDGNLDMARLAKTPWPKLKTWKSETKGRLILAVGGWERSAHFADVSASKEKRQAFVKSALDLCAKHDLDGLDLDWEHTQNAKQGEDYAALLADLHDGFAPKHLTVSVTIADWQPLAKSAFKAADLVQIMAYDHDGRHATLESAEADVKKLIDRGADKTKIVLGLPFYGRGVTKRKETRGYDDLVAKFHPGPEIDEVDGIYYNGPATIRRKVKFAREQGLGGVMVWEISQDAKSPESLLSTIIEEAAKP